MISKSKLKEIRKLTQKKYSLESGLFLAEGLLLLREAVKYKKPQLILISQSAAEGKEAICDSFKTVGAQIQTVSDEDFDKLSATKHSQGVMGLFERFETSINDFERGPVVVLDEIGDPGNAGTILRSCASFGAGGVIFSPFRFQRLTVLSFEPEIKLRPWGATASEHIV